MSKEKTKYYCLRLYCKDVLHKKNDITVMTFCIGSDSPVVEQHRKIISMLLDHLKEDVFSKGYVITNADEGEYEE